MPSAIMDDDQMQKYGKEIDDARHSAKAKADNLAAKGQSFLDRFIPRETREEVYQNLQAFASRRPKLAAFLFCQFALSGLPLLMFLTFSAATLIFSLVSGILLGILGALVFTAFSVGTALLFLVPTLFVTTTCATLMFMWGVSAFYVLAYFNSGKPVQQTKALGHKLDDISGGRLKPMVDNAKQTTYQAIDSAKQTINNASQALEEGANNASNKINDGANKMTDGSNKETSQDKMATTKKPRKSGVKQEQKDISPEDPTNGFTVLVEPVSEPFDQLDVDRMKRISDNNVTGDAKLKVGVAPGGFASGEPVF